MVRVFGRGGTDGNPFLCRLVQTSSKRCAAGDRGSVFIVRVFVCAVGPVVCAVVSDADALGFGFLSFALFGRLRVGRQVILREIVGERHRGVGVARLNVNESQELDLESWRARLRREPLIGRFQSIHQIGLYRVNNSFAIIHATCKKNPDTMPQTEEAAAWFAAVYQAVQEIPRGRVTSYGHIATLVGYREYCVDSKGNTCYVADYHATTAERPRSVSKAHTQLVLLLTQPKTSRSVPKTPALSVKPTERALQQ